jgi:hypothetical protein
MIHFARFVLSVLIISLVIAFLFMTRRKALLGIMLGLLPIAIMEIAYNVSLSLSIQRCLASACASSGLPPGCTVGDFGCNEWSGLARALFLIAGLLCLILYAVIVAIVAYLVMRKQHKAAGLNTASRGPESDQSTL